MNTTSIRIIGGRNKSYRIVFKASPSLRPTSDRAKETLFSWLQFEMQDKACLDLFSGTGSLGFEALSRGAAHVTFVEKDKGLFKNILKNICKLEYETKTEIACSAAIKWMQNNKRKFDIIFLDPPFDQVNYESLLSNIKMQDILATDGKIYLEIDKRVEIMLSQKQKVLKDKTIGDVRLMILQ